MLSAGQKINQLCISRIKIVSVPERRNRRDEGSLAKEQESDLAGKLVWAEAPCSFTAATSHALAAALSWLNMPRKCSPSCSNTAPIETCSYNMMPTEHAVNDMVKQSNELQQPCAMHKNTHIDDTHGFPQGQAGTVLSSSLYAVLISAGNMATSHCLQQNYMVAPR